MPLWHNSLINIEYRKQWENKGYHIVEDILMDDGALFSEEKMRRKRSEN